MCIDYHEVHEAEIIIFSFSLRALRELRGENRIVYDFINDQLNLMKL